MISNQSKIDIPNAVSLNEALLQQLKVLLARLEESLKKCREKYLENEKLYELSLKRSESDAPTTKRLGPLVPAQYFGAPYFKTLCGKGPPPNPEALYRKSQKCLYPMDLANEVRTQWTMADKSLLLQTIKQMVYKYCLKQKLGPPSLSTRYSLRKLLEYVNNSRFKLEWEVIANELFGRHTAFECQSMWNLNMHPKWKRVPWYDDEDDLLLEAARENNFQNWSKVADKVEGRSVFHCFLRYQTKFLKDQNQGRNKFTKEEDDRLVALVNEYKTANVIPWSTVASLFGSRTKQSLYYRYVFSLRPNISRERFSVEEDCIFIAALQEYGVDFRKIAMELPNRTLVQIRAHYNNVIKRNSEPNSWTLAEDKKLVKLHEDGLSWADIAKELGTHSRQTCRTRFYTIENFLKKNPKKKIKDVVRRQRSSKNNVTTENWAVKITEISKKLQTPTYSQSDMNKFSSFVKLLDIQFNPQLLEEFVGEFTKEELEFLTLASKNQDDQLIEIPLHKPTLTAFQNLRETLQKCNVHAKPNPKIYSKALQKERKLFKDQFKALFYLPGVLANLEVDPTETVLETPYGNITISYKESNNLQLRR